MPNFRINDGITVNYSNEGWSEFKKWIDGTYLKLPYVWVDEGATYNIAAVDGNIYRTCSINKTDAAEFESTYKIYKQVDLKTDEGRRVVTAWPTEGNRTTIVTHNWCDRTTWYTQSVRVVDEIVDVEDPGIYTTYVLKHINVIDTYHGKLFSENYLKDAQGNSFRAIIKVNDVIKTEQDPHTASGGDYIIDYASGRIKFLSDLTDSDVVKAIYHYENGGTFTLKSITNKTLKIRKVEVQFTEDVVIRDTVEFNVYGYVDVFAPHLTPDPYPSQTLIPLGEPIVYKTIMDYINETNGSYPVIDAIGITQNPVTDWRNNDKKTNIYTWDYLALTTISAGAGMEIRVSLSHNTNFLGKLATATFYCLTEL